MTEPANCQALDQFLDNADFFRGVLDQVSDGVIIVDPAGLIVDWNQGAERHTGYLRQEILGRHANSLLEHCTDAGEPIPEEATPLSITARDGRPHTESLFLLHKQGYRFPAAVSTSPIFTGARVCAGAVEIFQSSRLSHGIRPSTRNSDEIRGYDADTGLPGHELTGKRLREALLRARLEQKPLGVLVVDFNNLRGINARFGYEAGNQALRITAQTLTHCTRYDDFVGRWKDDSFLIIAFLHCPSELSIISHRLEAMVSQSVLRWWGESQRLKVTIGVSLFDGHGRGEELARRAEEIAAQIWAEGKSS